jgi:hypothetical protein
VAPSPPTPGRRFRRMDSPDRTNNGPLQKKPRFERARASPPSTPNEEGASDAPPRSRGLGRGELVSRHIDGGHSRATPLASEACAVAQHCHADHGGCCGRRLPRTKFAPTAQVMEAARHSRGQPHPAGHGGRRPPKPYTREGRGKRARPHGQPSPAAASRGRVKVGPVDRRATRLAELPSLAALDDWLRRSGCKSIVFIVGNKNLSGVKDKEEKQDISEISDQIQNNSNYFLKNCRI